MTEDQVQTQAVDAMRVAGLEPYATTAYKQKGGSGVDKGIPDVLVPLIGLEGAYLGLEFKKPGAIKYSSPEQEAAHKAGHFYVVQSLRDVVEALFAAFRKVGVSQEFYAAIVKLNAIAKQLGEPPK